MQVKMRCDTHPAYMRKYASYRKMIESMRQSPEGNWAFIRAYPTAMMSMCIFRSFQVGTYELINEYAPPDTSKQIEAEIERMEDIINVTGQFTPEELAEYLKYG
jgi:hypothetical protein